MCEDLLGSVYNNGDVTPCDLCDACTHETPFVARLFRHVNQLENLVCFWMANQLQRDRKRKMNDMNIKLELQMVNWQVTTILLRFHGIYNRLLNSELMTIFLRVSNWNVRKNKTRYTFCNEYILYMPSMMSCVCLQYIYWN